MTLPAYANRQLSFPETYEQELVRPLFQPWAELLIDAIGVTSSDRVLDVACGTGIVARLVRDRRGSSTGIVGVDLSPQMLAVARAVAPDIDWREGDASSLPLADGEQFDVVMCQQGLQFVGDKPAVARQMRRALAPGGRLAVATWRPLGEIPMFRDLHRIAERHLGPITDARHSFGETAPLETLLRDAGFRDVNVRTMSRTLRFSDGGALLRLNTMALVGMSAAAKGLTDEQRAQASSAIVADSAGVLGPYTDPAGLSFEISSNIATASA